MKDKMNSTASSEESIQKVEELYNGIRVANEKKLNKIAKHLEILDLTIKKINSSKKKEKHSKGLTKVINITMALTTVNNAMYNLFLET